jgi:Na+/phosphate symporter
LLKIVRPFAECFVGFLAAANLSLDLLGLGLSLLASGLVVCRGLLALVTGANIFADGPAIGIKRSIVVAAR